MYAGHNLKHDEREEDTGLCPRISGLGDSIHPESFERRQEHQANSPPMVQGEGEVQEDLVAKVSQLCALDIVVYLCNNRHREDDENKTVSVLLDGPGVDIHCVEKVEERELPTDTFDNDFFASSGKLVYTGAKDEHMNEWPHKEGPRGRGEIRLLSRVIDVPRRYDSIHIAAHHENSANDIGELKK